MFMHGFALLFLFLISKILARALTAHCNVASRHQRFSTFLTFILLTLFFVTFLKDRLDSLENSDEDRLGVEEALDRIERIKRGCGEVCNVTDFKNSEFREVEKKFDCDMLFHETAHDLAGAHYTSLVPAQVPPQVYHDFTYGGRIPLSFEYQSFDIQPSSDWTHAGIDEIVNKLKAKDYKVRGDKDEEKVQVLMELLEETALVAGKKVAVMGKRNSAEPWLEAAMLAAGAEDVCSLDRRRIESKHPKVHVMHPNMLPKLYDKSVRESDPPFDVVVLYDSLQSLGFGIFVDGLHPWADMVTAARMWCLTKPETGKMLVALPEAKKDEIVFNSHRIYGPILKTNLFANWKVDRALEGKEVDAERREYPITLNVLERVSIVE